MQFIIIAVVISLIFSFGYRTAYTQWNRYFNKVEIIHVEEGKKRETQTKEHAKELDKKETKEKAKNDATANELSKTKDKDHGVRIIRGSDWARKLDSIR
jgi:cytoskeletal protein RodZ